MTEIPLCSSRQVLRALERAGFRRSRKSSGSHQTYVKELPSGRKRICVVPAGKSELPRRTLKSILDQAGMTVEEFLEFLR